MHGLPNTMRKRLLVHNPALFLTEIKVFYSATKLTKNTNSNLSALTGRIVEAQTQTSTDLYD